jgi:hypothetical protein
MIPTSRVPEMMQSYLGDLTSFVGLILTNTRVVEFDGRLYWRSIQGDRPGTFGPSDNQNDRVVAVFRDQIKTQLPRLASVLGQIPEIYGVTLVTSSSRVNKAGETESETWHFRLPTQAIIDFSAARISEQELINAGGAYVGAQTWFFNQLTKVDVLFVAADD